MPLNEADTCRRFVVPKLHAAGWGYPPHAINAQRTFTDGRVFFGGGTARRRRQKRADYLLRYRPDLPIAVVEAKARYKHAADAVTGLLILPFRGKKDGSDSPGNRYTAEARCRADDDLLQGSVGNVRDTQLVLRRMR